MSQSVNSAVVVRSKEDQWSMNDAGHIGIVRIMLQSLLFCMHIRMKNPHLRAKLAEVLEAVMPHMEPVAPGAVQPIVFQRERVFCSYRHAPQLAEALITVFVDIEFTGEAAIFLTSFDLPMETALNCSTILNKPIFT